MFFSFFFFFSVGCWVQSPLWGRWAEDGWAVQETPSGALPFFIVAEKRKKAQQVRVGFPVKSTDGSSHPQTWDGGLTQFYSKRSLNWPESHICRSRTPPITKKKQTDGSIALTPCMQYQTPLLVLSLPPCLNIHVLQDGLSINPHTHRAFCPRGRGGGGGRSGGAERKRMKEEIAVWAEIRLLHFLGRKWIRSGESCSLLLTLKNATRLAFNPFSQTSKSPQQKFRKGNMWEIWSSKFPFDGTFNTSFCFASDSGPMQCFLSVFFGDAAKFY